MSGPAPILGPGWIAWQSFGRPRSPRARSPRPQPPWGAIIIKVPPGGYRDYLTVRLRVTYARFLDGPRWARRVIPEGSIEIFPRPEAEALIAAGVATQAW